MCKLSIITVNYNCLPGLKDTFQSVFKQQFTDFEYLVIDGASSDGSAEFIRSNADKISYWVSEKDNGIYHAMNKGIRQATGRYLYFLNAGDYFFDEDSLSRVFSHEFDEEIVYTNCFFCKSIDAPKVKTTFPEPGEMTFGYFMHDVICHQAQFIKKALFERHALYDEHYKIYSDFKFLLTAIVHAGASLRHLDEYPVVYNQEGISATNLALKEAEKVDILLKEFPFFARDYLQSDREKYELNAIRNHSLVRWGKKLRNIFR